MCRSVCWAGREPVLLRSKHVSYTRAQIDSNLVMPLWKGNNRPDSRICHTASRESWVFEKEETTLSFSKQNDHIVLYNIGEELQSLHQYFPLCLHFGSKGLLKYSKCIFISSPPTPPTWNGSRPFQSQVSKLCNMKMSMFSAFQQWCIFKMLWNSRELLFGTTTQERPGPLAARGILIMLIMGIRLWLEMSCSYEPMCHNLGSKVF